MTYPLCPSPTLVSLWAYWHLFTSSNGISCDTSLNKLHVLLPYYFLKYSYIWTMGESWRIIVYEVLNRWQVYYWCVFLCWLCFCSQLDLKINESTLNISKRVCVSLVTSCASVIFSVFFPESFFQIFWNKNLLWPCCVPSLKNLASFVTLSLEKPLCWLTKFTGQEDLFSLSDLSSIFPFIC